MYDKITEYHCCMDCKNRIEVPGDKIDLWEIGCLHREGKVNKTGGLTDCGLWEEDI